MASAYRESVIPHLTPIVQGNEAGETIVFIQGWPDDASLWDAAVAAVSDRYRCVRTTLPNYGGDRSERWGFTTMEILEALENFVESAAGGRPVTLVLHDWGCYWGHPLHNRRPDLVKRVAGIDVAPHFRPSAAGLAGIIAYQSWLYSAFRLGGPVGDWMTRRMSALGGGPSDEERLNAWMNYPYRNVWADIFSGRIATLTKGYWPTCPLLFVYGEKKPFPFHSAAWVDHVRKVGGQVVGLPCGHWVPNKPEFIPLLTRWLSDTAVETQASARAPQATR